MITKNYGLAGGTLDCTVHLERAAGRTLYPEELARWRRGLHPENALKLATYPVKQNPSQN